MDDNPFARKPPLEGWQPIATAPKDGTEVLLHYKDWLGDIDMVVSGHWDQNFPDDPNATWTHSYGYGDADHWMPLPAAPKLGDDNYG